jgi:hypothetical protein
MYVTPRFSITICSLRILVIVFILRCHIVNRIIFKFRIVTANYIPKYKFLKLKSRLSAAFTILKALLTIKQVS